MDGQMKPQLGSGPDDAAKTRMAMQVGAMMGQANQEQSRPSAGEEAAERAGRAARAAALAFYDAEHPETMGFSTAILCAIAQQAYGAEWQRLICTPRETWHQ